MALRSWTCWLGLLVFHSAACQDVMYGPCTDKMRCTSRQGDIVLGGLFPLHSFDVDARRCTGSTDFEGLQWVEAFRRAVEIVNDDSSLLSGVTLGYEARDTCTERSVAVQNSLHFVKGAGGDNAECHSKHNSTSPSGGGAGTSGNSVPLVGVVGDYSSSNSIASTELLGLFNIPMVSYGATNTRLSDSTRFNFFFRVLPSDRFTSLAIAGMARHFRWRFVSIVYSDDAFGTGGAIAVRRELEALPSPNRTCVAAYEKLPLHATLEEGDKNVGAYRRVLHNLMQGDLRKSTVVVLFLQPQNAKLLLQLASNDTEFREANFTFVGVDSWGDILSSVEKGREAAKGSVSAIPFSKSLSDFDQFLDGVQPYANNPWLCELWRSLFGSCACDTRTGECSASAGKLTSRQAGYRQSSKLAFVYDSVLAFAHALNNIKRIHCPEHKRVCPQMLNGKTLRDHLRNVSFVGYNRESDSETFSFDANGDPFSARYSIKNMVISLQDGRIDFPVRGLFNAARSTSESDCLAAGEVPDSCYVQRLTVSSRPVWNDGTGVTPLSQCSADCGPGEYAEQQGSIFCCWKCEKCSGVEFTSNQALQCSPCPANAKPSANRSSCELLEGRQWDIKEPLGAVVFILFVLLLSMCGFAFLQLYTNRAKAFLMGLGPTLLSLVGVTMSYLSMAGLFAGPSSFTCGFHEVMLSIGGILMSSPIVLYTLYTCSTLFQKSRFTEFLANDIHSIAVTFLTTVFPIVLLVGTFAMESPQTKEVIKPHSSRSIVCSHSRAFTASLSFGLSLTAVTVILCLYTLRLAGRQSIMLLNFRSLISTAMCGVMIGLISLSSLVVYNTLDDETAKASTENIAILMCVSAVLLLLLVLYIRKFRDLASLPDPSGAMGTLAAEKPENVPLSSVLATKPLTTVGGSDSPEQVMATGVEVHCV